MTLIKNITPDEVQIYWDLRLEALRTNPEAFGGTHEEVCNTPLEAVRSRIEQTDDNYILGAFSESNTLVGMLGFKREQSLKTRHKAFIWGMYVTPRYRNLGIGKQLLKELLMRSERLEGLDQITLCVVTTNNDARELYRNLGFKVYGLENNALKYNGQSYDEEHMVYKIRDC